MDGINRKPMQDVIVSRAEMAQKASRAPVGSPAPSEKGDIAERIDRNSFFKKGREQGRAASPQKKFLRRPLAVLLAIAVLSGTVYSVANYFSRVIVEIVPVTFSSSIDKEFIATKDPGSDSLSFQFMSMSEEKSVEVPATIEEKMERKASGTVIIYNAYSSASQKLIINTRLESSDHKIFRIERSVVVPGTKTVGGKTEPGSVDVVAYADAPGSEYNIGLADLTIPGLKGDPRYGKITARSKADAPFSGGSLGTVKVPAPEDVTSAQARLKEELTKEVLGKIRGEIPDGASFFPGSVVLTFEEVPRDLLGTEQMNTVAMKATASVFFFDTGQLTKELADASLSARTEGPLSLFNREELVFTFIDPVDTVVLSDLSRIKFTIKGAPLFVGEIDAKRLASELAGKNKKDSAKIIAAQSNIKKSSAIFRPFWNTVFPLDSSKIVVEVVKE